MTIEQQRSQNVEIIEIDPAKAKIARRYFARASAKFPASVTAQAAMVAIFCKEENEHPNTLRSALENSRVDLTHLANVANRLHMEKSYVGHVDAVRVGEIVHSVFSRAYTYVELPEPKIKKIMRSYKRFRREHDEMGYRFWADRVVEAHRRGESGGLLSRLRRKRS